MVLATILSFPMVSFANYVSYSCLSKDKQRAVSVGINTDDGTKVVQIFQANALGSADELGFGGWTREAEILKFKGTLKYQDGFLAQVNKGAIKGTVVLSRSGYLKISMNDSSWNFK